MAPDASRAPVMMVALEATSRGKCFLSCLRPDTWLCYIMCLFIYRVFTDFTDLRVVRLEKYPKRLVPLLELLLLLRELRESIFANFAEEPLFCVKSLFWARTQWINCCNGEEMRVNLAISCRFLGGLTRRALLAAWTAKSRAPLTLLYSSADETCLMEEWGSVRHSDHPWTHNKWSGWVEPTTHLEKVDLRSLCDQGCLHRRHLSSSLQITFITDQHDGSLAAAAAGRIFTVSADCIHRFDARVETCSVADIIHDDEAICPVKYFVHFIFTLLTEE